MKEKKVVILQIDTMNQEEIKELSEILKNIGRKYGYEFTLINKAVNVMSKKEFIDLLKRTIAATEL